MRARNVLAVLATSFLAASGPVGGTADARGPEPRVTPADPRLADATAPGFLENGGRLPDEAAFTLDGRDRTFFFGADGVTVALRDPRRPGAGRWVMKLAFDGARAVSPAAAEPRPGVTNLFVGPQSQWRGGLRSFGRLVYRDLWPGVDLVWTAEAGRLKWRCDVRAGADPSDVRFAVRGAESLSIGGDGALTASTPLADLVDSAPTAWQAGGRVEAAFRLDAASATFGVAVGEYDRSRDLVIDPSTVVRAGFIGGVLNDVATSVAVDLARNVYLAGITNSPETSFPTIPGFDSSYNGGTGDAYAMKFDANWKPLWSAYLGGALADGAAGIAVDLVGGVYLTGATFSPDFPVVRGLSAPRGGGLDAFVTKIAPSGGALVWSSVVGGIGEDRGSGIAVDRFGRAVVAGRSGGGMPWQGGYGGGTTDAFAFGVRADGLVLDWGLYLGGKLGDWASGVALDPLLNVYVCGTTRSTQTSFPVTVGPDVVSNGATDAWVAKLDPVNHVVAYAGFIGGDGADVANGIAADSLGRAYVVGTTTSDAATFPVAVGPHLVRQGKTDAFVARVAADGTGLDWCGYIGGTGHDLGYAIALDAGRRAYVVGTTGSGTRGYPVDRAKFPVVDGPDLTFNGGVHDGWLGVVQPDGVQMTSLGYIGGTGSVEDATAVAVHVNGDVVVAGDTVSPARTFPAGTGPAIVGSSGREAFLAQIQQTPPSPVLLVPHVGAATPNGFAVDVDWTDLDTGETGFDVERTEANGTTALFPVPSPAAPTGPVRFTDTTASSGTRYAYRVRGVSAGGAGEFSDCVLVKTTPSLALTVRSGSLSGAGLDSAGTANLRLRYAYQANAAPVALDPVANGVTVTIGGAGADQVVSVPPGDPGWAVAGGVSSWVGGGVRIVVNTSKRTILVDATGLTFAVAVAHNPVRVEVVSGGVRGARTADWHGVNGNRYAYP